MSIKVNLSGEEAWSAGGGLIQPGIHSCKITEAKEGTSSGGYDQIELELTNDQGATIRDWLVITPKTLGKIKQVLDACGVGVPEGEFDLTASDLQGKSAEIVVAEEPGQDGNTRSRVKAYREASGQSELATADTESMPF